jgi:putative ABC transport system permease protein
MLKNYLKIAFKVLLRRKFFTFISLFGISFTLVVLMVVTALLDHMFAPMAPETQQDRTLGVNFAMMYAPGNTWGGSAAYDLLDRYARGLEGVERLSIYSEIQNVNSYVSGQKITSSLKRTDGEFWNILQFTFLEGAPYTPQQVNDAAFVAVINDATRQRVFGGGTALGQTLEADGQRFRIVGVVANVSTMRHVPHADIWVPLTTAKTDAYKRQAIMGDFNAIALARDTAALPHIHDEFNARLAHVPLERPKVYKALVAPFETTFDAFARDLPIADRKSPDSQGWKLMSTLIGLGLLFMLLPAVNLMNINISRILERASEIGVRKAFGASSRTLVGQFVVENVLLTVIGGAIGFVLSELVLRALAASNLVRYAEFHLNVRIFLYGLAMSLIFGLLSGVYPAWRMSRLNPVQALNGAAR